MEPPEETRDTSTETLRHKYKPEEIFVLFVGEAPPSNDKFFYRCNSNLYRYTKEAFENAIGSKFKSGKDFLEFFCGRGFYLDDLQLKPISKDKRVKEKQAGVGSLAERIRTYKPSYVIIVMKGIQVHVRQAISLASVKPRDVYILDFPAQSHQLDYVRDLSAILRKLIANGVVDDRR